VSNLPCHCGWNGTGEHPCHRCHRRPGQERFYVPTMRFSLAGAQIKVSARQTIACVECWTEFQKQLEAGNGR